MSCADVCLDHDYDEGNDFYSETKPRARKPHRCCECGETIHVGAVYQRASGKADGEIWTTRSCAVCCEIRSAFVCGSWEFGRLWESIREEIFPIWEESGPIDCLAKVETLEARNKLREEYQDWKRK
jgi:hypothetical protein